MYGGSQLSRDKAYSYEPGDELVRELRRAPTSGREFYFREQAPGPGGDKYTAITENAFVETRGEQALSTFSIDVDTASYANVRQFLTSGQLPPPDAVRIEELINYFDYDYAGPPSSEKGVNDATPFASHLEVAACPWDAGASAGADWREGREMERDKRPHSNLVFLVDVVARWTSRTSCHSCGMA